MNNWTSPFLLCLTQRVYVNHLGSVFKIYSPLLTSRNHSMHENGRCRYHEGFPRFLHTPTASGSNWSRHRAFNVSDAHDKETNKQITKKTPKPKEITNKAPQKKEWGGSDFARYTFRRCASADHFPSDSVKHREVTPAVNSVKIGSIRQGRCMVTTHF